MAVVIEVMEHRKRTKYPWHEWADGRVWRLTRGVDYTTYSLIRAAAFHYAGRRGWSVVTRQRDADTVDLQFKKPGGVK